MTPLPAAYAAPAPQISALSVLATRIAGLTAVVFSGAIFGFFYAWVCSTMWGLDATDPRVAIQAMQAMNGSVRNAVFAPAFFGTPFVLWIAALLAWRIDRSRAALAFGGRWADLRGRRIDPDDDEQRADERSSGLVGRAHRYRHRPRDLGRIFRHMAGL